MEAPDVRVAGDDGSNIVRAAAIVGVGIDHDGTVTARLRYREEALGDAR